MTDTDRSQNDRQTRDHPPINGCTRVGPHPCILTTGRPVPLIVSPFVRRAQSGTLPASDRTAGR